MKRFCFFLFLATTALAAEPTVRVVLDLNDSSRLLGVMTAQTVSVTSPTLGALNVALERISLVRMERGGEALFFLRNGDKLQGKPAWSEVKLTTKLGELSVPLAQLRQLETLDADGVPATLGDGLLLHLRFDRKNSAAKIHDAKPAVGRHGQPKSALEFDGKKTWVEVVNEKASRFGRQITMAAWVKQTGNAEQQGLIVGTGAKHRPGAGLATSGSEGVGWAPLLEGNEGMGEVSHPADLADWTLLVGTYDGVTAALYVNGRQVQTQRQPGVLAARANVIAVGGAPTLLPDEPVAVPVPVPAPDNGPAAEAPPATVPEPADGGEMAGWFKGLIDEVRIYDRALSADEVRALYEATK